MKSLIILFGFLFLTLPALAQSEAAIQIIAKNLELDDPSQQLQIIEDVVVISGQREEHRLRLSHPGVGISEILIDGPIGFMGSEKKRPLLFVSAGFFSGKESIQLIPDAGDKILVGYQYPVTKEQIQNDPSLFPKTIRIVPGQMALLLHWLSLQPYVQNDRIHVMGVSLGTLFLPVALHLAQKTRGFAPASTLLCFGGADIASVVENILGSSADSLVKMLAKKLTDSLLVLHDPRLHLPHLKGSFFTVYATDDNIFPRSSSLKQYELLPNPKEIHWIKGPHIDESHPELIVQTMILVREFLKQFDAI